MRFPNTTADAEQVQKKKGWSYYLKLAASIALSVFIIVYLVDIDVFIQNAQDLRFIYLLISFFAYFGIIYFISARWFYILKSLDAPVPMRTIIALYFKHNLINQFSPGSLIGDGYRIGYVCKEYKYSKTDMLSGVLFERVSGLATKFILLVIFAGIFWNTIDFSSVEYSSMNTILIALAAGIGLGAILFFFMRKQLLKLLNNFKQFLTNPRLLLVSVAFSLAVQLFQIVAAYGIVLMMDLPVTFLEIGIVFIVIEILMLIPLSVNGWGTREIVMIAIFAYFEVSSTDATFYALLSRAVYTVMISTGVVYFIPKLGDWLHKKKSALENSEKSV